MKDTGPPPAVVGIIHTRAGFRCEVCGGGRMYDVHHRKPRRMGGTSRRSINSPENLLLLCRACHNRAEQHREWAYAYGLLVHDWAQPEDVPVMVHGYPNPVWLRGGEYKPSPQEVPGG